MKQISQILSPQLYRDSSSITSTSSIEIPEVVDDLIDNKAYRNKFKKLIREGHLAELVQLAEVAQSKNKPKHFFAKWTRTTPESGKEDQPTNWERTREWLAQAREVARTADEVVRRLGVSGKKLFAVYKACWKRKDALRLALIAEETARGDRCKYFCWLAFRS